VRGATPMQAPHWSQGMNRYAYVFNDPVNATDPSGFLSMSDVVKGFVTAGHIAGAGLMAYGSITSGHPATTNFTAVGGSTGGSSALMLPGLQGQPGSGPTVQEVQRPSLFDPEVGALACGGLCQGAVNFVNRNGPRLVDAAKRAYEVSKPYVQRAATRAAEVATRLADAVSRLGQPDARGVPRPTVTDPKLGNLVRDLYKGTNTNNPIGTGSTADAIRHELATGQAVGGKFHAQKGAEYARALENWLSKNPSASAADRSAAQAVLDDLRSALGSK
jgi:hypothetical protein